MVVSQAVQAGGSLPGMTQSAAANPQPAPQPATPVQQHTAPASQPQIEYQPPVQPAPIPQPESQIQYQQPQAPATEPQNNLSSSPFIVPPQDINIPMPAYQPPAPAAQPEPQFQFSQPTSPAPAQSLSAIPQANAQGFDLRQIFQNPQMASGSQPSNVQPSVQSAPEPIPTVEQIYQTASSPYQPSGTNHEHEPIPQPQIPDAAKVSAEERPMGEVAQSTNPEIESTPTPDWLVPKIFKGGNLG